MENKKTEQSEDWLKRLLYVYDLPHEVLDSLTLKEDVKGDDAVSSDAGTETPQIPKDNETSETTRETSNETPRDPFPENLVGAQTCSLCGLSFSGVLDQRSHLKSDFHHYNLKQKLRGRKPVSESEFERLIGDLDESLSGSDTTEDDDEDDDASRKETTLTALLRKQATLPDQNDSDANDRDSFSKKKRRGAGTPPLLWFSSPLLPTNHYFGVYRAIFTPDETKDGTDVVNVIKQKQLAPITLPKPNPDGKPPPTYNGPHIFLCMIGGGHFAAMIVSLAPRQTKHGNTKPTNREATVLAHKTFHRYTTRRKQGGSQSANDNAKGNAHSAGSSIRRYNEQALTDEVRALLRDWKALLDTSELLFIRATGVTNRRTLFGPYEDQVLRANDPRIRGFPFSTRRATQNELMRSFVELTRLKAQEINPVAAEKSQQEPSAKPTHSKPAKPAPPKLSEEEETALLHTSQLQAFVRRSKLPALLSYLKNNELPADYRFQPADAQANHHAPTPLHLAASQNAAALVSGLLLKAGADPGLRNAEGKTAFELAGDRATRDAFRVARHELGEARCDWDAAARVPPALSRADAERRDESERADARNKEAARRRAEEDRLRAEGPRVPDAAAKGGAGRSILDAGVQKSAQDRREEEARGLTPEQRMKLDRERRARAAEERLRRMQAGG